MLNIFFILLFVYNISTSQQINNKIIEGDQVSIEEFPYVVSVRYGDHHVCGGAILDEKTVLTSAQCVFDLWKIKHVSVRVGSAEHANGLIIKVSRSVYIKNPPNEYKREFHENDIGIFKLASKLTWSDTVKPIRIPKKDFVVPDDTAATFVGWGVTTLNGTSVSDTLRKSETTTVSYIDCNMQYGMNMISHKMVCAQAKEHEFCRGDIGGPLVLGDQLIGVASWIYDCDQSTFPGVYTNTAKYFDWIKTNLEI